MNSIYVVFQFIYNLGTIKMSHQNYIIKHLTSNDICLLFVFVIVWLYFNHYYAYW